MWVCLASAGYTGSTLYVALGSLTRPPPTRIGAFGLLSRGAIGAVGMVLTPSITPPITPPIDPPATPPGTPPATPLASTSGGSGDSLISAIVFGITAGATSFPAFSNTLGGGIAFTIVGAAGGGGGGGGGATRNVCSNCFKLIVSV